MKTVILLMVISACSASNCSSNWTEYKTVQEASFRYSSVNENEFIVNRTIRYRCFNNSIIQFKTNWTTREKFDENVQNFRLNDVDIQTSCLGKNCENIMLQVSVDFQTRLWRTCCFRFCRKWTDWSSTISGKYFFAVKNCDKLYWTSWIETTSCATSAVTIRRRTCMDCDGDALEQKYCDATGHAVDKNDCNHHWGNWTEESCVTTGCNTAGERVRTRQRLYVNGHEAADVRLCSNSNESAFMQKEECINTTIPAECLSQISSGTGNAHIMGFYLGIGVAVAMIVILCVLLVFARYRRLKSTHLPRNATAKTNQTSPYEFANASVKADEQSNDVSQPAEISQQNSTETHEFANPTTSANYRSLKDFKSTEQNKHEGELVENRGVYDIAQLDGSNAHSFEQASDQEVYVIETPDVSNAYAIVTGADPHVHKIKDSSQHPESNLPTAHSIEENSEQNNNYSSLLSSSGVMECTYSKLER